MNDSTWRKYKQVIDEWFLLGRKPGDGTRAYTKVYGTKTEESARVNFSRLLTNATVQEYVEKKQEENQKRLLQEYHVGIGDLMKVLRPMAIEGERIWRGVQTAIEVSDQQKAIDMLLKIIGGYAPTKNEHTGKDGEPLKIEATIEIIENQSGHKGESGI